MQQVDFTAPANQTQRVAIPGKYVKYLAGNNGGGDASLVLTPGGHGSSKIVLQVGQAYRVAADAQTPDSWTITNNAGGATIIGKLVIGNGQIDDPTIAGTVQVIDGGKSRTLSNSAFAMFGNVLNGVASQYTRVQLWNPVASGKRIVIETVTPLSGSSGAQSMALVFNTAQLATLIGAGVSKLAGGAGSAGLVCTDTTATASAAGQDTIMFQMPALSNQQYRLVEPLILPPGNGLVMWGQVANAGMGCTFEWYEEPNV